MALSKDGKTLAFVGDSTQTPGASGAVYSYQIADGKTTKLSDEALTSLSPVITNNGSIVSGGHDTVTEKLVSYAAGSTKAQELEATSIKNFGSLAYDPYEDRIYVAGSTPDGYAVGYATLSDLVAGKQPTIFKIDKQSTRVVPVTAKRLALFNRQSIYFVDITGKALGNVNQGGDAVGMFDTSSFKASSNQSEQIADVVDGYNAAPKDFQSFLASGYKAAYDSCTKNNNGLDGEYTLAIVKVVRDTFAETDESCGDGFLTLYKKTGDVWAKVDISTQMNPTCTAVSKYAYTKEIISECSAADGSLVKNTNP
jgi:hypothetical protein